MFSLQSIELWTVQNVVEWMATVNLIRYVEVFRRHEICGKRLAAMDDAKLAVSATLNSFIHLLTMLIEMLGNENKYVPIHLLSRK